MAAAIVYEGVPNTQGESNTQSETGLLFQGQKFWFSATVPQRLWFIENVKANGGEVVQLEKQADVLIFDHKHKNPAPGTHSYRYVELSIRKGRLEDLADHAIGGTSRADRPVSSVTTTPKGGRNPYTEADDQFLWNWVKPLEEAGGATAGNSIYQQLEAANPRHTYQSWRDRWLKYVRHQKKQITTQVRVEEHLPSTPRRQRLQPKAEQGVEASPVQSRAPAGTPAPARVNHRSRQQSVEVIIPPRNASPGRSNLLRAMESRGKAQSRRNAEYEKSGKPIFKAEDYDDLFDAAPHILAIDADGQSKAWGDLARSRVEEEEEKEKLKKMKGEVVEKAPRLLAGEWREYFASVVVPDYHEQLAEETGKRKEDYLAEDQPSRVGVILKKTLGEGQNAASPASPTHKSNRTPSLSFQSESPIASSSTAHNRAPGPNEARKRSVGKGTDSQDSPNSTAKNADSVGGLSQRSIPPHKRKRCVDVDDDDNASPSLPPFSNQEQAKRRTKSKEESKILEIPSTPDRADTRGLGGSFEERDSSQEAASPTPRPQRSAHEHNGRDNIPSSPLFIAQDNTLSSKRWSQEPEEDQLSPPIDAEVDEILPATGRPSEKADLDAQTSPLSVHLVSDHDPPAAPSFSLAQNDREQDNGSPTPEFETAPEFSQVWDTALEETATTRPHIPRWRDGTIPETQPENDFTLPEPEGGWDDLPLPPDVDEEETVAGEEDGSHDEDDAASEAESIGGWIAAHLEADPDVDDELLMKAAGIADLDFRLADLVYQLLAAGKAVPENMMGVWTERDDMALRGNDAGEIMRVEKKHGKESLPGRWQWLENEQG